MLGYPSYSSRAFRDSRKMYPTSDLAGIWALQRAESGRCTSSMSFDGAEFSSYSTVVATIINYKGRRAYVLTTKHYSVTTSGHMSHVRSGIPVDAQVFDVPEVSTDPHRVLKYWQGRIESKVEEFDGDGCYNYLAEAEKMAAQMAEFAAYFKISLKPYRVKIPSAVKYLAKWKREAKQVLARIRKSDPEFHEALTVEAYKLTLKIRYLVRGTGLSIEDYRVTLPMKEQDIREIMNGYPKAALIREHIMNSSKSSASGDLLAAIDALNSMQPTETEAA